MNFYLTLDGILAFMGAYFFICLLLYFIPFLIAINTSNSYKVFLLNLFLGWTAIGWIGALIWAINSVKDKNSQKRHEELLNKINFSNQSSIIEPIKFDNKKSTLLNELSKIYDLKEKGIITLEMYEKERHNLLQEIDNLGIIPTNKKIENAVSNNYSIPNEDPIYNEMFNTNKNNLIKKILAVISIFIVLVIGIWAGHILLKQNSQNKFIGFWQPLEEENSLLGLSFSIKNSDTSCNWTLRHDCNLSLLPQIKQDTVYLYGKEFEGGNFFMDFFHTKDVKDFNNGTLFCFLTNIEDDKMTVSYVNKVFIKNLDEYLNKELSGKFPKLLYKKE